MKRKDRDPLHMTPLQARADSWARLRSGGCASYYLGRYEGWLAGYRAKRAATRKPK